MNKWINIDLHTHSYYSKKYDQKRVREMSAPQFVNILANAGIDLFSVTDHDYFSSNFYRELTEAIKGKEISFIPGAELNIYVENAKKFQANFYFSLNSSFDTIEETISELYKEGKKPELSDVIDALNQNKLDFIMFPEADKSGGISKVISALTKNKDIDSVKKFQQCGMQRIFKAYDSTLKFNKTSANQWALSYYKLTEEFNHTFCDMNESRISELTGKISKILKGESIDFEDSDYNLAYSIANKIEKYAGCFSYFHFSDWHNAEDYSPQAMNYIYGSIKHPFESLEMAVLDPISRVNVQELGQNMNNNPDNFIKRLEFELDGVTQAIDFSVGLNAIIGKRASGKSLLMSIILKLYDKEDKELSKYLSTHKVDENSICCETFDGQKLSCGQLGSLSYIRQDTISNIFNDPSKTENEIKQYFKETEPLQSTQFESIKSLFKELKPYNTNYKSITAYLKNANEYKSYSFKDVTKIDATDLNTKFDNLNTSILSYEKEVEKIGFSKAGIERLRKLFSNNQKLYDKKISIYNNLIGTINSKIQAVQKVSSIQKRQNAQAKTDYQNAISIIKNNLKTLLQFKKIEYLFRHFNVVLPKMVVNKKDKFLFVSYYQSKPTVDIKESLNEILDETLIKKGHSERGISLLREYLNGGTTLKSNVPNIYQKFDNKFLDDNIIKKNIMFEVKDSTVSEDSIKSVGDLNNFQNSGKIENITDSSLGRKSIAYIELALDSNSTILLFDQPEDNVDNNYISEYFVPLIKEKKKTKQLIFITHNPSVAVYADAFNYIYATNEKEIRYANHYIDSPNEKETILSILDGGAPSFSNRNLKYGNVIGEYRYDSKNN